MGCFPATMSTVDENNTMPNEKAQPVHTVQGEDSSSGIRVCKAKPGKMFQRRQFLRFHQIPGAKLQMPDPLHTHKINRSELARACSELDLDQLLQDSFQVDYLLRYTVSEYSSENVVFLRGMRKLYCESAIDSTCSARLVEELIATHFEEGCDSPLNIAGSLKQQITAWHKSRSRGEACELPFRALDECRIACRKMVLYDIFPRFKLSPLCVEMLELHLQRHLPSTDFRNQFLLSLTEPQRDAVNNWLELVGYAAQCATCAATAPAMNSMQMGQLLYHKISASLHRYWRVGSLEHQALLLVENGLDHASPQLFQPLLSLLLEFLQPAYFEYLASPAGRKYLRDRGLTRTLPSAPTTSQEGKVVVSEDYASAW